MGHTESGFDRILLFFRRGLWVAAAMCLLLAPGCMPADDPVFPDESIHRRFEQGHHAAVSTQVLTWPELFDMAADVICADVIAVDSEADVNVGKAQTYSYLRVREVLKGEYVSGDTLYVQNEGNFFSSFYAKTDMSGMTAEEQATAYAAYVETNKPQDDPDGTEEIFFGPLMRKGHRVLLFLEKHDGVTAENGRDVRNSVAYVGICFGDASGAYYPQMLLCERYMGMLPTDPAYILDDLTAKTLDDIRKLSASNA